MDLVAFVELLDSPAPQQTSDCSLMKDTELEPHDESLSIICYEAKYNRYNR